MSRHRLLNVRTLLPIVAAMLLVIAVACGSSATATPRAAAPTAVPSSGSAPVPTAMAATEIPAITGGDAKYGGNIRMSAYADTRDWDPVGSASLSSIQAYSQLYNQLIQFDTVETTKIVGDLADSWEISDGGQTFTFKLNKDVRWHDGVDLTASDVVFALSRYMDPENAIGRSGLFRSYVLPADQGGITEIDADTVEMKLSFASGAFINFLALDYAKILPKHILERGVDLNQAEGIIENSSGSGPFRLEEYQRGNSYSVSRNDDYFKEGRPFFDSIEHFIITDGGTMIAQFKAGQIDMMNGAFSTLSPTEYLELDSDTVGSSNGHVIAHSLGGTFNNGLMMNRNTGPLQDPRVRKAIYLALDRAEINRILVDNTGGVPCALLSFGYTAEECAKFPGIRDKSSAGGQADLAFAKQLMVDAGFPDGFEVTFDARQTGNYSDVCSIVKQQLANTLGISGDIRTHESAAGYALFATARSGEGDWDLACQGEGMTVLDPDALIGGVYVKGATRNYTNWEPETARTAFEAQKVEQDPARRRQILRDYEDWLIPTNPDDISQGYSDNHWITMYWGEFYWLVHEDIRGFNAPATVQTNFKHEDLWLDR